MNSYNRVHYTWPVRFNYAQMLAILLLAIISPATEGVIRYEFFVLGGTSSSNCDNFSADDPFWAVRVGGVGGLWTLYDGADSNCIGNFPRPEQNIAPSELVVDCENTPQLDSINVCLLAGDDDSAFPCPNLLSSPTFVDGETPPPAFAQRGCDFRTCRDISIPSCDETSSDCSLTIPGGFNIAPNSNDGRSDNDETFTTGFSFNIVRSGSCLPTNAPTAAPTDAPTTTPSAAPSTSKPSTTPTTTPTSSPQINEDDQGEDENELLSEVSNVVLFSSMGAVFLLLSVAVVLFFNKRQKHLRNNGAKAREILGKRNVSHYSSHDFEVKNDAEPPSGSTTTKGLIGKPSLKWFSMIYPTTPPPPPPGIADKKKPKTWFSHTFGDNIEFNDGSTRNLEKQDSDEGLIEYHEETAEDSSKYDV